MEHDKYVIIFKSQHAPSLGCGSDYNPLRSAPIYYRRSNRYGGFGRVPRLPNFLNMHFLTTALKSLEPRIDDDFVDRLCYYYTPSLMIVFAILVSAKQYIGHPIECWVPATFTKAMEQYTENYCWVQNTYWVPFTDLIPNQIVEREKRQIGYYQWVPFILAIQALLFYIPAMAWRMLSPQSGINLKSILSMVSDDHNVEPENRVRTAHILARHIDDLLRHQRDFGSKKKVVYAWAFVRLGKLYGAFVSTVYIVSKLLYLINVIGQFFLLNRFLQTDEYPYFGVNVLTDLMHGNEWQNSGKFPRVTLCDFEIRALGNVHRHSVQCVLVINLFTEKIFVFLWLWLVFLCIACLLSAVYWSFTLYLKMLRILFVRRQVDQPDSPPLTPKDLDTFQHFVTDFLRPDGVFILRMIAWSDGGSVLCSEITNILWTKYKEKKEIVLPSAMARPSIQVASIQDLLRHSGAFDITSASAETTVPLMTLNRATEPAIPETSTDESLTEQR